MAVAKITETIPAKFGIYDLTHLLECISVCGDDPIITVQEPYLEIRGTDGSSRYACTPAEKIHAPLEEDPAIEQFITRFELPNVQLQHAIKVLSTARRRDP
jgi:hypothetical protein